VLKRIQEGDPIQLDAARDELKTEAVFVDDWILSREYGFVDFAGNESWSGGANRSAGLSVLLLFCLAIKSDLAGQLNREVASSVRINFPPAGRAALPGVESQCHGNSAAEGSAHVRVLSKHPHFGARSNYAKSNQLRGVPAPNVYLFGPFRTKPPALIVGLTVSRCSIAGIPQAGRRRPVKSCLIIAPELSPPDPRLFWPPWAKYREDGYLAPTNAT
jgi:hypothetical protein